MIETIIKCDNCTRLGKTYKVIKDKTLDASGNGYEDVCIYPDFCLSCLIDFARQHPDYKVTEK